MTTINGQTQILGLVGECITQSVSYQLHNHCLKTMNINAVYIPLQSSKPLPIWTIDHFLGANITMPFKQILIAKMDILTESAKEIGSINTIHKIGNQLIGDNTDGMGFLSAINQHSDDIPWNQRPVYIIGAGGAAKAICWALKKLGVSSIFVWNRTPQRIEQLRGIIQVEYWDCTKLPNNAIVIQCTPIGTNGGDPLSKIDVHPEQIIIDLIYQKTPLLARLENVGGLAINGMGMLVHQAAYSFSRWFQCPPPIELMWESLSNNPSMEIQQ